MSQGVLFDPGPGDGAILSEDRLHRFRLWRYVDDMAGVKRGGARVLFVMLNPSTADETMDDLTIKKCIGFAQRWGVGGGLVEIVNLFSYRATDPADLWVWCAQHGPPLYAPDEITQENEDAVLYCALAGSKVVLAWGAHKDPAFAAISDHVVRELDRFKLGLWCLGTTKDGHPRHPSRLGYYTALVPYVHARGA